MRKNKAFVFAQNIPLDNGVPTNIQHTIRQSIKENQVLSNFKTG